MFRVPGVGDNGLVFGFCVLRLIAGTLLIRDVARGAARRPPRWAVALAMLVFALASPTPYTLARAGVYEAAIMGGASFMVAGLYLGHRAMTAAMGLIGYMSNLIAERRGKLQRSLSEAREPSSDMLSALIRAEVNIKDFFAAVGFGTSKAQMRVYFKEDPK